MRRSLERKPSVGLYERDEHVEYLDALVCGDFSDHALSLRRRQVWVDEEVGCVERDVVDIR